MMDLAMEAYGLARTPRAIAKTTRGDMELILATALLNVEAEPLPVSGDDSLPASEANLMAMDGWTANFGWATISAEWEDDNGVETDDVQVLALRLDHWIDNGDGMTVAEELYYVGDFSLNVFVEDGQYRLNPGNTYRLDMIQAFSALDLSTMARLSGFLAAPSADFTCAYYNGIRYLVQPSDHVAFLASATTDGSDATWLVEPQEHLFVLGLNPYLKPTDALDLVVPLARIITEEKKQTQLLLINLVATLIASDGLRYMIEIRAQHEEWTQAQLEAAYAGELATQTINLITAMGAAATLSRGDVAAVAQAIAGYIYVWAANTGWNATTTISFADLFESAQGRVIAQQVPARLELLRTELQRMRARVDENAAQAAHAATASAALSGVSAIASVARAAL